MNGHALITIETAKVTNTKQVPANSNHSKEPDTPVAEKDKSTFKDSMDDVKAEEGYQDKKADTSNQTNTGQEKPADKTASSAPNNSGENTTPVEDKGLSTLEANVVSVVSVPFFADTNTNENLPLLNNTNLGVLTENLKDSSLLEAYQVELPKEVVELAQQEGSAPLVSMTQAVNLVVQEKDIKQPSPTIDPLISESKTTKLAQNIDIDIPSAVKIIEKVAVDGSLSEKGKSFLLSSTTTENIAATGSRNLQEASTVSDAVATINQVAKSIAQPQTAITANNTSLNVTIPFQQAQWGEAVAEKVMWMSAKGVKTADIQLDPPELGPLTVKVSVNQDQAQVSFTVQHASVKEALDQSALRLREMFAEEGINLADVDVSEHSQSQENNEEEDSDGTNDELLSDDEAVSETVVRSELGYGLIDSYV